MPVNSNTLAAILDFWPPSWIFFYKKKYFSSLHPEGLSLCQILKSYLKTLFFHSVNQSGFVTSYLKSVYWISDPVIVHKHLTHSLMQLLFCNPQRTVLIIFQACKWCQFSEIYSLTCNLFKLMIWDIWLGAGQRQVYAALMQHARGIC